MAQIISIFTWISIGFILRAIGAPPKRFSVLNRFIVSVPLPATILLALHGLRWETSYWLPVSMAWIVFAVAALVFSVLGRLFGWRPKMVGALIMTGGLGNTSFLGFPLLRALYGEKAIIVAVLTDQPGSFLALATVGVAVASYYSSGKTSRREIFGRIAQFPPVWALVAAIILRPFVFPTSLSVGLGVVSKTLIPLALISVGGQLRFDAVLMRREKKPLFWGLLYKLALAPLLITVIAVVFSRGGESARITVLEAGMGPMITAAIVAEEHGLDAQICSLMVAVGLPLCLLTVPLWAKTLAYFEF